MLKEIQVYIYDRNSYYTPDNDDIVHFYKWKYGKYKVKYIEECKWDINTSHPPSYTYYLYIIYEVGNNNYQSLWTASETICHDNDYGECMGADKSYYTKHA